MDLVALNLERGRDHGIPGYTAWYKLMHDEKITSFHQLKPIIKPQVRKNIVHMPNM